MSPENVKQKKCIGTVLPSQNKQVCPKCTGTGRWADLNSVDTRQRDEPCPDCEGSGTVPMTPEDVIAKWFPEIGYPPKGKFRVICGEMVEDKYYFQGDYEDLTAAKKYADRATGEATNAIYTAAVYNDLGQEVYVGKKRGE